MRFQLLLTFISFFLASFSAVLAAPSKHPFEKREDKCPSLETLVDFVGDKGFGENTVFYTYPGKDSEAVKFAKTECNSKTFVDLTKDMKYINWMKECAADATARKQLFRRASQAMARKATGVAFLILPKGAVPDKTSVWWEVEYPELLRRNIGVIGVTPGPGDAKKWDWYEYDPAEKPST
ncbi:hypothetical protein AJ79_03139 [Helicocarpus griseus UAMH5409]|uniref:Ecp2 effector protein domain-containing protein n=1 Tax=Helicocarpus griseus UAMH5409 TaxID=1447875 RepID=A0A2B7Y0S1_9EURO|nr:hypothetical protein AJ79_03139 [Helicocarpus griseus UAMH5409]